MPEGGSDGSERGKARSSRRHAYREMTISYSTSILGHQNFPHSHCSPKEISFAPSLVHSARVLPAQLSREKRYFHIIIRPHPLSIPLSLLSPSGTLPLCFPHASW